MIQIRYNMDKKSNVNARRRLIQFIESILVIEKMIACGIWLSVKSLTNYLVKNTSGAKQVYERQSSRNLFQVCIFKCWASLARVQKIQNQSKWSVKWFMSQSNIHTSSYSLALIGNVKKLTTNEIQVKLHNTSFVLPLDAKCQNVTLLS